MFPTLVRRLAEATRSQLASTPSPTKLKKVWPPDFTKLSPQAQFRFEKRYKRRVRLRSRRPLWDKGTKLAQYFSITMVIIYGVLFMDAGKDQEPFQEIRAWFWGNYQDITGVLSSSERSARLKNLPESKSTSTTSS